MTKQGRSGYRLRGQDRYSQLEFVLQPGINRAGALPGSEITIRETGVSKQHAVIHWDGGIVTVDDQGSKNGTFLNGQRISRAVVRPGDSVGFGPVIFILEPGDPAEAEIALPCPSGLVLPADSDGPAPVSASTSVLAPATVPGRWLHIVTGGTMLMLEDPESAISPVLQILAGGTGARGAALISWCSADEPVVAGMAGAIEPAGLWQRIREEVGRALEGEAGGGRTPVILFPDGAPPLAIAAAAGPEACFRALLVTGDFPARSESRPLLEAVFNLLRKHCGEDPSAGLPSPGGTGLVFPPGFIAGGSAAAEGLLRQLHHLTKGRLPVLITGETGVGKEHAARIIHASSERRKGPFVAVNCAAIPADLMEVEFFGIEKGVATGVEKRDGKFQLAHGGVIFLDEIGDMPAPLQSKVLRALQDQLIWPVGARQATPVDVRVISSTNRDLARLMGEGLFRPDLYYRIAGYELYIPPLRERREDIPVLISHFMQTFTREAGKRIRGVSAKALEALCAAPWPGNIRELENEVRRLVYTCPEGQPITSGLLLPGRSRPAPDRPAADTPATGSLPPVAVPGTPWPAGQSSPPIPSSSPAPAADLAGLVGEQERQIILQTLTRNRWNRSRTAKQLGLSRNGLAAKMRRLGLSPEK